MKAVLKYIGCCLFGTVVSFVVLIAVVTVDLSTEGALFPQPSDMMRQGR